MRTALSLLVLLAAAPAFAQVGKANFFVDVGTISARFDPPKGKPGDTVKLIITVTPKPGCYTYTYLDQEKKPTAKHTFPFESKLIRFSRDITDPPGAKEKAGVQLGEIDLVYRQPVTWELTGVVADSPPGRRSFDWVQSKFQVCTEAGKGACFNGFPEKLAPLEFEVLPGGSAAPPPANPPAVKPDTPPNPPPPAPKTEETPAGLIKKSAIPVSEYEDKLNTLLNSLEKQAVTREGGVLTLLLTAAFWGLVSLATPCVFPMIPITVSLFLKQSHNSTAGAVKLAAVYSVTILVVLGLAAVLLLSAFRVLSVDPFMNVFLGGLFVFFTLSLFGLYEATIRATLWFACTFGGLLMVIAGWNVNSMPELSKAVTAAKETNWTTVSRTMALVVCVAILFGLWRTGRSSSGTGGLLQYGEAKRKQGGLLGTVFGGVMFSIVSFTCVAPFLGGFAGMASSGQYTQFELVLAGLTFAGAFAAPFFVLALFPSLLKKMPKSGGWLDSVKVVMGFLEIAAALKFFRSAELRWLAMPQYFTYDLVLAAWVVIAAACGLYLLGVFRLPHDEEKSNIGVYRLIFALLFLGVGVYLLPGVFKGHGGESQRPGGVVFAWVDAFLLPEPSEGELPWGSDLPDALKRTYEEQVRTGRPKYVFVDFTGVTCTNCKANEQSVFTQEVVKKPMRQYALVQMYTDDVPAAFYTGKVPIENRRAEAAANLRFQLKAFGTEQLPLYAIFEPTKDGARVVGVYDEGKINNTEAFVEFLKGPVEKK